MRRLQSAVSLDAAPSAPSAGVDEIVRSGSRQSLLAYRQVPIDWIEPDPEQPRRRFDPETLEHLAEDIRRHQIDTPLSVRTIGPERFRLLAGERRLRAARIAGLATVPIFVRDDLSPEESELLRLRENLQREDLSPIEEARGLKLYKETARKTWEEVGREFGWKKPTIMEKVRLLDAPEPIRAMIEANRITPSHYTALAALPEEQQLRLAEEAAAERLSIQDVRRMKSRTAEGSDLEGTAPQVDASPDGSGNGLRSLGTQTPQEAGTTPADSGNESESLGTQTPQRPAPVNAPLNGMGRRSADEPTRSEIRFYTTPDCHRRLRHIAAELTGGSVAQLTRNLVEWFAERTAAGEPAPWLTGETGE